MSDFNDSKAIADRIQSATRNLHRMASQVGSARQIKEFASDLRKAALSIEVTKHLKAGESATAAEHMARASAEYQQKLTVLAKQSESAEQTIAQWAAEVASFDAARSLLSFSKETMRQLEG